jgi:hypothetical protein
VCICHSHAHVLPVAKLPLTVSTAFSYWIVASVVGNKTSPVFHGITVCAYRLNRQLPSNHNPPWPRYASSSFSTYASPDSPDDPSVDELAGLSG